MKVDSEIENMPIDRYDGTKHDDKYILLDEDTSKPTGYIIEHHGNKIYVTFWAFHGDNEEEEKYDEKNVLYSSLESLYNDSKRFVASDLIAYSPLHESKYKMMCDFIKYYDDGCKRRVGDKL